MKSGRYRFVKVPNPHVVVGVAPVLLRGSRQPPERLGLVGIRFANLGQRTLPAHASASTTGAIVSARFLARAGHSPAFTEVQLERVDPLPGQLDLTGRARGRLDRTPFREGSLPRAMITSISRPCRLNAEELFVLIALHRR